jgi:peptidoglycan/xylan/chitin deacetylase (PgdA/CDA1 family)
MLKRVKKWFLGAAAKSGISMAVLNSGWRSRRLLILCYHGISLDDEHLWRPGLYMPVEMFRRRMEILKRAGAAVLTLEEGLERLYAGTLPKRGLAITFDDGNYDFYRLARPVLREFGYPATVYVTTYYAEYNRPVFDPMCRYLLWMGRDRRFEWEPVMPEPETLDEDGRNRAAAKIMEYASRHGLSGRAKDGLLEALAQRLGVDYAALCAKRILHLMTPAEIQEAHAEGTDIQLHTHSHRLSREEAVFRRQVLENRERIRKITGVECRHFCYPSGYYEPEFPTWLRQYGIRSATTCDAGLASRRSHPLLLPRLLDYCGVSEVEFEAWVAGIGALLPRRRTSRPHHEARDSTPH